MSEEVNERFVSVALEDGTLDQKGYSAMRDYAQWHLGDPSWAYHLLNAYLNPGRTKQQLNKERRR